MKILLIVAALFLCFCPPARAAGASSPLQKRWLFVWRNMSDPKEVDRMIARFPAAEAAGYNGVVFSYNVTPEKAAGLKEAARQHHLDLIAIVMGNPHDRNYTEGVLAKDVRYAVHDGVATHDADNPTRVVDGGFEDAKGNHFTGWSFQDDEGVTSFCDTAVRHNGKASLRMENIGQNQYQHCRLVQPIKLAPHRQYRISFWLKTDQLSPAQPEIKILTVDAKHSISFQSFHADETQDWKHYDLVFNSLDYTEGRVYLGAWSGKTGKMWWDDLTIEEIALVNVLRRPGCPVTVRADNTNGTVYEEGHDYQRIVDPQLHPYIAYHDPPVIELAPRTRIRDGEKLRVSYYHPLIVYEDRLTGCLSEPKIFDDWRNEVKQANDVLHPAAFLMSHDELRVMNQCALCQRKKLTPGELLAWNVHQAAQIIRNIRPDAGIWVGSDMFDPMHNAVENFYAVNGSLAGSWKGLDKDVGIVNWHGSLRGKNCRFFADLGLKQILSGYYDSDEDGSGIRQWLENTKKVPGVVGAMYTTWEDKYGAMETWAKQAWGTK